MTSDATGQPSLEALDDELLLSLLCMDTRARPPSGPTGRQIRNDEGVWVEEHIAFDAPLQEPKSPLLFHWGTEDRLFARDAGTLLRDPSETVDELELWVPGLRDGEAYLYFSIRKRATRPKTLLPASIFYDLTTRRVHRDGRESATAVCFAWSKRLGKAIASPLPQFGLVGSPALKALGEGCTTQLVLAASIVEDAESCWRVSVQGERKFWIYSDEGHVKELCDLRDSPRHASGRRKAILHWVRSHQRKPQQATEDAVSVLGHLRGVTTFELGGFVIEVVPPKRLLVA